MDLFYPVKLFADWVSFKALGLYPGTLLGEALDFFIYDTIKIITLLFVIIFAVSVIRTFLPAHKIRQILAHENRYIAHITAAAFGIFTPFCTCSAIPLFLGFLESGVPLGVTFTFLVSSPMINEVALGLLLGMFGLKVAGLYVASGMLIAIGSGAFIGKVHPEYFLQESAKPQSGTLFMALDYRFKDRLKYASGYTLGIIKQVWLYVVIGVGVGAWIHGYVPVDFLAKYAGRDSWFAVPLATLIGIPLYAGCAGVIPLVGALIEKGVSMGTALAFMMAVTGLSLPEFLILRKVIKTRLILIFAAVVGTGIIFTGYIFNAVLR